MNRSFGRARTLALRLGLLAVLLATILPLAGSRAAAQGNLPADWVKGAVMIGYSADPYAERNMPEALASLRATGATSVAVAPRWFMANASSTEIKPDPAQGTPSDESLINVIRVAKSQGFRVHVRPYIDIPDGTWRADITPSSVDAWFASYTAFIDHYLDIAQREGVEEFSLGVELINMTQPVYDQYWLKLIAEARQRFSGKLTYSANWGKPARNEYKQITWWGQLDFIGISAYFPLALNDNPTTEQLVQGWSNYTDRFGVNFNWVADLKATADQFNKKIVFTEIGFESFVNSPARYEVVDRKVGILATDVQDRAVEATMQVFSKVGSWFGGIYWWHWEPYVGGGGPNDLSDTLNNKPAVQTLTRWFGGSGATQPQPTNTPGANPQPTSTPTTTNPPAGTTPRPAPQPGQAGVNNPYFDAVGRPGPDSSNRIYFDATGHTLQNGFLQYWNSHGGLPVFGYPLSEEYWEISATDGKPYLVQYFERQRFEYHPEAPADSQVLLGLLGVALVNGRTDGPFAPVSPITENATTRFFAPTGHTLGGSFKAYWEKYGGLPIFGYPLSEPFQEKSTTDGKTYTVQYFERARFEYHAEYAGTFNEVLLGFLGHWYAGK